MKPIVAIERCNDYEPEAVQKAVGKAVEAAGGLEAIIKQGDRVFLKVNLLNSAPVERAVTTHPEITRAMIRLVKKAGGEPVVGDAPGLDLPGMGKKVLRTSGTLAVCEQEEVPVVLFTDKGYEQVTIEQNTRLKSFHIARDILQSDVIICLPKAKSHMQAYYTGAIKNFFGVVPQKDRKIAHSLPGIEQFSESLVDIFAAVRPAFGLMDAIIGMEGPGPSDGKPRKLGLVLASSDLVALDKVTSTAMGYDVIDIPQIRLAAERELGENDLEKITIAGPPIKDVRQSFELPPTISERVPGFVGKLIMKLWKIEPKITPSCILCGHCESVCPADAITMGERMAVIDYKKCIGCYCCHELCPSTAIKERSSLLVKLFRLWEKLKYLKGANQASTKT